MGDWRRYEDLRPGLVFPDTPTVFHVTPEVVDGYRAIAQDSLIDGSLVEREASGPAGVPPMLAALYIRGAQDALRGPPGGIHAKQRFTFHRPVRVGDTLHTTLTIADTFERNGRRYVVSDTTTLDAAGTPVTSGRITSIWGQQP